MIIDKKLNSIIVMIIYKKLNSIIVMIIYENYLQKMIYMQMI